jgi:hypothetical protein
MLLSRIKMKIKTGVGAGVFGLLAIVLVGSVMASSAAAATEGPFWMRKNTKGTAEKIEPKAPENFRGGGGEQRLIGKVAGTAVETVANSTQVKGAIFNGSHQGQVKIEIAYSQPTLVKPELKGCTVLLGERNIVQAKGFLVWKWNGEKKQLEPAEQVNQTPSIDFSGVEPTNQEPEINPVELTKLGTFTTIKFSSGCGVLAGSFNINGNETGLGNRRFNEFSKILAVRTMASEKDTFFQHFWNPVRSQYLGLIVGLTFGGEPAALIGQSELESEQAEVEAVE